MEQVRGWDGVLKTERIIGFGGEITTSNGGILENGERKEKLGRILEKCFGQASLLPNMPKVMRFFDLNDFLIFN